jgi:hypothetical protein
MHIMKKVEPMIAKRLITLLILPLLVCSCDDNSDGYTQIKGIEHLVYMTIKEYRTGQGLTGPFAHQPYMVKEAQVYSLKMAYGSEALGIQGLAQHWSTIHEKLGGYNDQALVMRTASGDEDIIVSELMMLPEGDSVLLEDVTQCGVGIEADSAGNNFVTILLMKID